MYSLETSAAASPAALSSLPRSLCAMRAEIETAASSCRIPADDFLRMVVLNATREVRATGQITIKAWPTKTP